VLTELGLSGAWALLLPAIVLVLVARTVGRASKHALQN
jgi:hypothetical protein